MPSKGSNFNFHSDKINALLEIWSRHPRPTPTKKGRSCRPLPKLDLTSRWKCREILLALGAIGKPCGFLDIKARAGITSYGGLHSSLKLLRYFHLVDWEDTKQNTFRLTLAGRQVYQMMTREAA